MNYLNDYKQILDDSYINREAFYELETEDLKEEVEKLGREIKHLSRAHQDTIEKILKLMTELSIYKKALGVKMRENKIPDVKIPERVYVQLRGAVPLKKGERVWVGHYLGKVEEVCDDQGKVLGRFYARGREAVVKKIVERIKEAIMG
jgi:hypothetical protein